MLEGETRLSIAIGLSIVTNKLIVLKVSRVEIMYSRLRTYIIGVISREEISNKIIEVINLVSYTTSLDIVIVVITIYLYT